MVHSRIGKLAPRHQVQVVRECMEGRWTISRPDPGEQPITGVEDSSNGLVDLREKEK
jgi:hypothetical protein